MKISGKKILSFGIILCIMFSCFAGMVYAKDNETIVILYENDVHCVVEGYSKLAAMKTELSEQYNHVGVVSSGDFAQGGTLGSVSKGEFIVKLMNIVGYDALTLGNHEFDYYLSRLDELVEMMNTKPVSCNFYKIGEDETYFQPYSIVSYGDVDVAYIGIISTGTVASSNPAQFKNDDGEFIYTFSEENLYDVVQKTIDEVEDKGADIVIALSHIGYVDVGEFKDIVDIIENTEGLDAVLDAHTHSVIEGQNFKNKLGEDVLLTSTGTGFQHIGKLTIKGDEITSELIKTETVEKTDKAVDDYITKINEEYAALGNRRVGESTVELNTHDSEGNRLVRNSETNLGNLCADALKEVTNADIAYVNGGGVRAPINVGDVTYNDIYNVFPFNNKLVVAEATGKTIRDMLEMAVMNYPAQDGSFPHVAGMTFSVDKSIPSSVKIDESSSFISVDGEYRVYNINVLNKETGKYEPIKLDKTYTMAGVPYFLVDFGGGMTMLKDAKIIQDYGMLDVDALEVYISENLGGVIGEKYAKVENRIDFTDGKSEGALSAFSDLSDDAWYSESAKYVLENGLMNGVNDTAFAPNENLTRAMLVTVLYRAEKEPATNRSIPFADVDMSSYYANAVSWAKQNGIVNGATENEFAPNDNITREQIAAIMLRYAVYKGMDALTLEENLHFADNDEISEYAVSSMNWAVGTGLIKGKSETTLAPKDNATRIEVAAILHRFLSSK